MHVLDARTGGECQYPKDNALGLQFNFWRGWLPDGRLVTLDAAGELVALDRPCGGNMVLLSAEEKPACLMTNPDASESCSPGDSRRGITIGSGAAYTTTVVNVSTGKAEAVIPWQFSADGLGNFPGPLWLSEAQFILHRTDEGPLLVTLGDQFSFPLLTGQSLLGRHRMGLAETGDRTVRL